MANDLEIIEQLVKKTGKEIKELNLSEIIGTTPGYASDEKENVTGLNLYGIKEISDYSFLKDFENLTVLDLTGNHLPDIIFLKDLRNLTHVNLEINQIRDISALDDLTHLTGLNLGINEIPDISVLNGLTKLTHLDLGGNQISDISSLSGLRNLTFLNLSGNDISDISVLTNLTNLTELYLSSNHITDISKLGSLKNLRRLYLDSNKISDIPVLQDLTNLTGLNISANQISDISSLKDLPNLARLDLSHNKISQLPPEMEGWNIKIKWNESDTGDMILTGNPIGPSPEKIVIKEKEEITVDLEFPGTEVKDAAEPDKEFKWDVFISYSSKDFPVIEKIVEEFKRRGIRYWWDDEQLRPGDSISAKIADGLKKSRYVMPCLSNNQLTSGWCRAEYTAILNKVIGGCMVQKVVPLVLDELNHEDVPLLLSDYKYERLPDTRGYEKLLSVLSGK